MLNVSFYLIQKGMYCLLITTQEQNAIIFLFVECLFEKTFNLLELLREQILNIIFN